MAKQPGLSKTAADEALRWAMQAIRAGRPDEAARIAGDALKRDPRDAGALQAYGCALLMQGRAREAIASLEEAARARQDPEADTQLAIALRQAGRMDDALGRLKRAIKRKPPYAAAFHELGFLLFSMRRYDEAIDALKRGIEIAPMMPELWMQLANVLVARKDRAGGRAAFARVLAIAPDNGDALFGLGMAHAEDGEYAAAADCLRSCLMSRPDDANIWINLGHCLIGLGQREAGYDCFRSASRGDPKRYGLAVASLVTSNRGRFWLRPSAAAKFFGGKKN